MLEKFVAFVKTLGRRGRAAEGAKREPLGVIEHDARAVRVVRTFRGDSQPPSEAEWGEVSRVVAYKRDAFIYDVLSLAILLSGRPGLDVNEDMDGWEELLKKLPEYLPGCRPFEEWFQAVAFPAFAMNPTEIFRREEPAPEKSEGQTEGDGRS